MGLAKGKEEGWGGEGGVGERKGRSRVVEGMGNVKEQGSEMNPRFLP